MLLCLLRDEKLNTSKHMILKSESQEEDIVTTVGRHDELQFRNSNRILTPVGSAEFALLSFPRKICISHRTC
jgi:hypothetical protein